MDRPKLTADAAKKYIESGGAHCPFCESDKIAAGPYEADGLTVYSNVTCRSCGEEWIDEFTLSGVEQADELVG